MDKQTSYHFEELISGVLRVEIGHCDLDFGFVLVIFENELPRINLELPIISTIVRKPTIHIFLKEAFLQNAFTRFFSFALKL